MKNIYFGGSRSLPAQAQPYIERVIGASLASGHSISVGCAVGADQQVILAALRSSSFQQVRVFSAFDQAGKGAWSGSAVSTAQAFAQAGGSVAWLAGGPLSAPLVGRLMARSIAGLAGASAAIFFAPGIGSLKVAGVAASRGIPIFAFSKSRPALPRATAGAWGRSAFLEFPCWQFQPAQKDFF
jgi:hypothetical protein